ncbi:MAG: methyltransferase [Gemmatimonadetes bacterium]|nr:methyltransferase [Gemmatimonadota bacterium]
MIPMQIGTPADFAAARTCFAAADYTVEGVCRRLGIQTVYEFRSLRQGREGSPEVADPLDLLIRLFLDGAAVDAVLVHELLPPSGFEALTALGLLDRHPDDPGKYAASVLLYPTESLYIASDLGSDAPGLAREAQLNRPDRVYRAITPNTQVFLCRLPTTPCERFLDLCSGTGIAALVASRYAAHAWAVDITERSTRFAEFNARLNGIDNVTTLQGDLYEPVAGITFDRIAVHPPYVPATEQRYIYRDGGEDGEEVLWRIVARIPEHLRPGGRFFCTCAASDRSGAPLEQRIRAGLGKRHSEFDVVVVTHYEVHPSEFYYRMAAGGRISFAEAEERHRLFQSVQAEQTLYCSIVVQRHTTSRPAVTVRRKRGKMAECGDIEWLLDWSAAVAASDLVPELLDARPVLSPDARLHLTHQPQAGEWIAETCTVAIEHPFPRTVELSPSAALFLPRLDGTRTTREHLQQLQAEGEMSPEITPEAFAAFIRNLVTDGVVQLAGFRLPARSNGSQEAVGLESG